MIDLAESLVFGGGHGIGLALVQRLQEISPQNKTVVSYRNKEAAQELFGLAKKNRNILIHPLDPIKEESLKTFFAWASQNSSSQLNLSICCIGALASQGKRPERALKDLDAETMLESFSTNCVAHALILKHLKALIPRSNPFVLAHLSARVGSLEDNSLGGWHSYRMSKAALNMLVKNAAIELKRDSYQTIAISLHPGTTHTQLSQAFVKNVKHKIWTPKETAEHILQVIQGLQKSDSGCFLNWDGNKLHY